MVRPHNKLYSSLTVSTNSRVESKILSILDGIGLREDNSMFITKYYDVLECTGLYITYLALRQVTLRTRRGELGVDIHDVTRQSLKRGQNSKLVYKWIPYRALCECKTAQV